MRDCTDKIVKDGNGETRPSHMNILNDDDLNFILNLARSKSPSFIIKFYELFPDFRKKLIELVPNIIASDLEFCAYLKLNFSTKEIARYADLSVRAVESKKYRLRKKFGISSNSDLNIWISCI